jgi:hypothetical protein
VEAGKCSKCSAEIVWAETVNGKKQPFDAKPEKRNIIAYDPSAGKTLARVVDTYMPHHATCPAAASFRRPRPKAGA